jgi:hypothetical protein
MAAAACSIIPRVTLLTKPNRYRPGPWDLSRRSTTPEARMCTTAQTAAARSGTIDAITARVPPHHTMLFTTALLVAVSAVVIIHKARVAARGAQANLGWMSTQWLAEHRSSHPS